MKISTAVMLLIIFLTTSVNAQDTIPKDNKWFTEFLIANSSGFTINLFNGTDLAIGRRIFKNTDLRITGGFDNNDIDHKGKRSNNSNTEEYLYENTFIRYSAGLDILYRIGIAKSLIFKVGLGYNYQYRVNETKNNSNGDPEVYESKSKTKNYSNHFKAIGSFHYFFTGNIYAFVQGNLSYVRSHETSLETANSTLNGYTYYDISRSNDFKQNDFEFDNFFLGGGISF